MALGSKLSVLDIVSKMQEEVLRVVRTARGLGWALSGRAVGGGCTGGRSRDSE